MKITNIIFDLDGTLIDSAPSILATLATTLASHGIQPKLCLEPSIIGPPLRETFSRLTGEEDFALLDSLTDTFKSKYDSIGYRSTTIFPGVSALLKELAQLGIPIHIATNKRLHPTRLILDYLGWNPLFSGVYALDCVDPPHLNKAKMLAQVLRDVRVAPQHVAYVGDKRDDGLAADENSTHFFMARWGYGALDSRENSVGWQDLLQPADLLAALSFV